MKYFEILYKNCFDQRLVGFACGQSEKEATEKFPIFNGCRLIDIKETDYYSYRSNKIQHFIQHNLSVQ